VSDEKNPLADRLMTFGELSAKVDRESGQTLERGRWGRWKLDRELLTLQHVDWRDYEVDLERIRDAASLLDCIMWAAKKVPDEVRDPNDKSWMIRQDVGDLVEALHFIYIDAWRGFIGDDPAAFLRKRFEEIETAAAKADS
jgi:hypothetical protein